MAPILYYLNKNYMSNGTSDGIVKKSGGYGSGSKSAKFGADPDRPFFWLRTLPGTILLGCIGLGLGSSFYNVYVNDLPPTWFYTMADPDSKALYFSDHFMRLWTHLAVFAMGILAGLECRRATRNVIRGYGGANIRLISQDNGLNKQHKNHSCSSSSLPVLGHSDSLSAKSCSDTNNSSISIDIHTNSSSNENINLGGTDAARGGLFSTVVDIIGCLLAITTMTTIIFSTHDWSLNDLPKPLVAGLFDSGSRLLWSAALIWILYMISVPNSDKKFSILSRLLGHPSMVCLGKLSFLIYTIHPFVHTAVLAIQEQPIYSSWLMLFHILIGNITITVILASLVSLFVEMPCRNLFRRCGTTLSLTHTIGPPSSSATSLR